VLKIKLLRSVQPASAHQWVSYPLRGNIPIDTGVTTGGAEFRHAKLRKLYAKISNIKTMSKHCFTGQKIPI
jgi:hypothetical protein